VAARRRHAHFLGHDAGHRDYLFAVNATPLDERFEHLDAYWKRWQLRPSFQAAYADRNSGVAELDQRGSVISTARCGNPAQAAPAARVELAVSALCCYRQG